jgi:hypothetical protein
MARVIHYSLFTSRLTFRFELGDTAADNIVTHYIKAGHPGVQPLNSTSFMQQVVTDRAVPAI